MNEDEYKIAKRNRRENQKADRNRMRVDGRSLITVTSKGVPLIDITIVTPAEKAAKKAAKKKGKK